MHGPPQENFIFNVILFEPIQAHQIDNFSSSLEGTESVYVNIAVIKLFGALFLTLRALLLYCFYLSNLPSSDLILSLHFIIRSLFLPLFYQTSLLLCS